MKNRADAYNMILRGASAIKNEKSRRVQMLKAVDLLMYDSGMSQSDAEDWADEHMGIYMELRAEHESWELQEEMYSAGREIKAEYARLCAEN